MHNEDLLLPGYRVDVEDDGDKFSNIDDGGGCTEWCI